MGKVMDNSVADAMLAEIATAVTLTVCSAEPTGFADISNVALADATLTAGLGNGDYTAADGDTNGRKVTVSQQADVPIDTTGTATHIVLDDGSTMLYVTTCTSQALTSGGTVTVPAWDVEVADPS